MAFGGSARRSLGAPACPSACRSVFNRAAWTIQRDYVVKSRLDQLQVTECSPVYCPKGSAQLSRTTTYLSSAAAHHPQRLIPNARDPLRALVALRMTTACRMLMRSSAAACCTLHDSCMALVARCALCGHRGRGFIGATDWMTCSALRARDAARL